VLLRIYRQKILKISLLGKVFFGFLV